MVSIQFLGNSGIQKSLRRRYDPHRNDILQTWFFQHFISRTETFGEIRLLNRCSTLWLSNILRREDGGFLPLGRERDDRGPQASGDLHWSSGNLSQLSQLPKLNSLKKKRLLKVLLLIKGKTFFSSMKLFLAFPRWQLPGHDHQWQPGWSGPQSCKFWTEQK